MDREEALQELQNFKNRTGLSRDKMIDLYNNIISEISRCTEEIRKVDNEIIKLQERRYGYSDRKIMLEELKKMWEEENSGEVR